jgi:hypothetical protein
VWHKKSRNKEKLINSRQVGAVAVVLLAAPRMFEEIAC